ncbi:MAG: hypothetical protein V3R29_09615 [Candidatus Acidoferrales bacterium]
MPVLDPIQQKLVQIVTDSLVDLKNKNFAAAQRKSGDLETLVYLAEDNQEVLWLFSATFYYTYQNLRVSFRRYSIPTETYDRILKQLATKVPDITRAISERNSAAAYTGLRDLTQIAGDLLNEAGYRGWDRSSEMPHSTSKTGESS